MDKKMVLAQFAAEAISSYKNEDATNDALWLMNAGLGDVEDQYENLEVTFKEVFGVTFSEAKKLSLF